MTRKQFLKAAAMGAAGLAFVPALVAVARADDQAKAAVVYCVRPLPGKKYSPSFLKFCERTKFTSAAAAVRRVKDRSLGYLLVAQPG
jgi:hypothetical protein